MSDVQWKKSSFSELKNNELYDILALRQEVFVIEQECFYPDLDGLDQGAFHFMGWRDELVAYTRIIQPGVKFEEPSFGRVLTRQSVRGQGIGRVLIAKTIACMEKEFSTPLVRISAQQYLEKFYQAFGFRTVSDPYLEDDIPHVEMLRNK